MTNTSRGDRIRAAPGANVRADQETVLKTVAVVRSAILLDRETIA